MDVFFISSEYHYLLACKEALLVFSEAYLVGSIPAHRRGVTVIPERMLAGSFGRRRPQLTSAGAAEVAARLRLALEDDAAA